MTIQGEQNTGCFNLSLLLLFYTFIGKAHF